MRARSSRHRLSLVLLGIVALSVAPGAAAYEFFDDSVQVHGFFETQIRGMARDFNGSDNWDLTQFANSLNIEIEWDVAPDGIGPFDIVSMFARIEVRYDCVYIRACGLFSSANTYGDAPKRLPKRMGDARRAGFNGAQFTGNMSKFLGQPRAKPFVDRNIPEGGRSASPLFNTGLASAFFGIGGVDGMLGTADDPAPFYFSRYLGDHCRFGARRTKGPEDGVGNATLGPLDFACKVRPIGAEGPYAGYLNAAAQKHRLRVCLAERSQISEQAVYVPG